MAAEDMNKRPNGAQPSAPEEPRSRKVSEEELKRIPTDHDKWLETGGKEGSQADLRFANLKKAEYLTQQQLDEACGNKETKLPEGFAIETCPEDK